MEDNRTTHATISRLLQSTLAWLKNARPDLLTRADNEAEDWIAPYSELLRPFLGAGKMVKLRHIRQNLEFVAKKTIFFLFSMYFRFVVVFAFVFFDCFFFSFLFSIFVGFLVFEPNLIIKSKNYKKPLVFFVVFLVFSSFFVCFFDVFSFCFDFFRFSRFFLFFFSNRKDIFDLFSNIRKN